MTRASPSSGCSGRSTRAPYSGAGAGHPHAVRRCARPAPVHELRSRGWDTSRLLSHYEAAQRWGGSDHTDPNGYFAQYGKSRWEFKQDVASYLGSGYVAPIAPTNGNGGTYQPSTSATRTSFPKSTGKSVNIHYALHNRYGAWNEAVTNFNDSNSEGFAGMPFGSHDMLIA